MPASVPSISLEPYDLIPAPKRNNSAAPRTNHTSPANSSSVQQPAAVENQTQETQPRTSVLPIIEFDSDTEVNLEKPNLDEVEEAWRLGDDLCAAIVNRLDVYNHAYSQGIPDRNFFEYRNPASTGPWRRVVIEDGVPSPDKKGHKIYTARFYDLMSNDPNSANNNPNSYVEVTFEDVVPEEDQILGNSTYEMLGLKATRNGRLHEIRDPKEAKEILTTRCPKTVQAQATEPAPSNTVNGIPDAARTTEIMAKAPAQINEAEFGQLGNLITTGEFKLAGLKARFNTRGLPTSELQAIRVQITELETNLTRYQVKMTEIRNAKGMPVSPEAAALQAERTAKTVAEAALAKEKIETARLIKVLEDATKEKATIQAALTKAIELQGEVTKELKISRDLNTKLREALETAKKNAEAEAVKLKEIQAKKEEAEKIAKNNEQKWKEAETLRAQKEALRLEDLQNEADEYVNIILTAINTRSENPNSAIYNLSINSINTINNYIEGNSDGEVFNEHNIEITVETLRLLADEITRPNIFLNTIARMQQEAAPYLGQNQVATMNYMIREFQNQISLNKEHPLGVIENCDPDIIEGFMFMYVDAMEKRKAEMEQEKKAQKTAQTTRTTPSQNNNRPQASTQTINPARRAKRKFAFTNNQDTEYDAAA